MLNKYNIAAKKSKYDHDEFWFKSLCGSGPAEKLNHVKTIVDKNFHGREFKLFWGPCLSQVAPLYDSIVLYFNH